MTQKPWPRHADGRAKKVGEMTIDEQRGVFKAAAERVKAELEAPAMQEALGEFLSDTPRTLN